MMYINLTGNVWGWPVELIGKISGLDLTTANNIIMPANITLPVKLNITQFEFLEYFTKNILPELKTIITIEIAIAISTAVVVGSVVTIFVIIIKDFLENRRKIQADRSNIHSRLNGGKIHLLQSFRYIGNIKFIKTRNEKILELTEFRDVWWKDLGLASTIFNISKEYFYAIKISEDSILKEFENHQINHKKLNILFEILEYNIENLLHIINYNIKSTFCSRRLPKKVLCIFGFQKDFTHIQEIPSEDKDRVVWILENSGGEIERIKLLKYLKYMNINDSVLNDLFQNGIISQQLISDREMIILCNK